MKLYEIFSACLPRIPVGEKAFEQLAELGDARVLEHRENGETVAFAAVKGDAVRLLCVHPAWQRRGIGTALLRQAEDAVRAGGEKEIWVGGYHSHLLIGAPDDARDFFQRRGYERVGGCEEMTGDLNALLPASRLSCPPDVAFGWYDGDTETLQKAVAAVDEDWVQYFSGPENVYCAVKDGQIASFCFAEGRRTCILSTGENNVGIPGCVGTVPAFRRQGIGLKMVAKACEELKTQGCDTAYIHYTGVARWYERLGFATFLRLDFLRKATGV
ncbi:MAG: GNAT family N-acetyltransferase [Clostridiales bacterium]|nr:GNAT family N-acetyltransferase [Clostridiales bacterium]